MALFYSRSHSQWRAAGICIGEDHRRGMGIACQRNHIKRVYFPDNLEAFTSKDSWLIGIGWALLTIVFEFAAGLAGGSTVSELLAAYNPLSGNLWLLVLATTLLSPIVTKKCRFA